MCHAVLCCAGGYQTSTSLVVPDSCTLSSCVVLVGAKPAPALFVMFMCHAVLCGAGGCQTSTSLVLTVPCAMLSCVAFDGYQTSASLVHTVSFALPSCGGSCLAAIAVLVLVWFFVHVQASCLGGGGPPQVLHSLSL